MSTAQSPTIPHYKTVSAMIQDAMEQRAYDYAEAAHLVVTWLEADEALVQQFGRELWRLGAYHLCTGITRKSRTQSLNVPRQFIGTAAADAHPSADLPSGDFSPRRLTPQRPTGAAHLGRARIVADGRRYMDFQLGHGLPLWRADRKTIRDQIAVYDTQLGPMVHRRTWLVLVENALPTETVTVGEALSESRLEQLWQEAEQHPNAAAPEEEATTGKMEPKTGLSSPPLVEKQGHRKTKVVLSPRGLVSPVS